VAELEQRLRDLEERLKLHAGNSSIAPSSNPRWAPAPVKKKPTGRKPGGQPGHEGYFRQLLAVEQVDEVVEHVPQVCPRCGGRLAESDGQQLVDRHQVAELPRRPVHLTEHQAYSRVCGCCGEQVRGQIPASIRCAVTGPRLSAVVGFVSARVHGSRRATEELLSEALGCPLALGTVINREKELTLALSEGYQQAQRHVRSAPAKNVDETGWKGAGRYLWVAATHLAALFRVHRLRNRHAMEDLLGSQVLGTICTDRYGVYERVPVDQRQVCWAHLRRDFQRCVERGGVSEDWGRRALQIANGVHASWTAFRGGQIDRAGLQAQVAGLRAPMHALLQEGQNSGVKKLRHFCRNVAKVEAALWRFAEVEGIEPTNNHAERMLRPAVIWRKESQGSRSERGCRFVERMLSVIQTLRLQGRSVLDYLAESIAALREGRAPPVLIA
jgi:transposase